MSPKSWSKRFHLLPLCNKEFWWRHGRTKYKLEFGSMLRISFLCALVTGAWGQTPSIPRLPDGHPNLQGVWRSASLSAAFDVQAHEASYQVPAGASVIVDPPDGKLPYLPEAAKKAKLNSEEAYRDPVGYCHPHGVPRQLVPPFPLELVQDGDYVAILSETEHSVRVIPLDGRPHRKNYWAWMGDSRGRWEGDTLVVDVTGFNRERWLDQAGNYVDENERVVERFTMTGPDRITYEATVTDPTVYSRPWTMRITLARQPKGTELIEYDCVEGERDIVHHQNLQRQRAK